MHFYNLDMLPDLLQFSVRPGRLAPVLPLSLLLGTGGGMMSPSEEDLEPPPAPLIVRILGSFHRVSLFALSLRAYHGTAIASRSLCSD